MSFYITVTSKTIEKGKNANRRNALNEDAQTGQSRKLLNKRLNWKKVQRFSIVFHILCRGIVIAVEVMNV